MYNSKVADFLGKCMDLFENEKLFGLVIHRTQEGFLLALMSKAGHIHTENKVV